MTGTTGLTGMSRALLKLPVLFAIVLLSGGSLARGEVREPARLIALSGAQAAEFSLPSGLTLVRTLDLPAYGLTHERYQQYYGPLRAEVLGAQITILRDRSGVATSVIGYHYPSLQPLGARRLPPAAAAAIVNRDIGESGDRRVDLLIDPRTGSYFHRFETRRFSSRWVHWIDAEDGRVLQKYDALATGHGIGVKGDVKDLNGPDDASPADDLTVFHFGDDAAGHDENGPHWDLQTADGRQITFDMRNGTFFLYWATDAENHWDRVTADRASPGQPALVDAHYYANLTDDYFLTRHGFDWRSCYTAMRSIAHYDLAYNNAFWNGTYTVYGDGDGLLLREMSGGLDVVAHENTHGVTDCTSNLIYLNESGALNESFSDILGTGAEFYADVNVLDPSVFPDWSIGEDVYLPADEVAGFRNMADPAEDGHPDHYSERQVGGDDNGGVHRNSGIPNHAFYLLVNGGPNAGEARGHPHSGPLVNGIGLADAERIFFLGFTSLATDANLCNARAATEAIAAAQFGPASLQALSTTDAWVAVGLTDEICGTGPAAPTGLTASAIGSDRIELRWTDNSASETGFKVERSTNGLSFTQIAVLGANVTSYVSSGLAADSTYYYRVRAYEGSVHSIYSNVASATTGPPPPAPSGLAATALSTSRIDLLWTDNSSGESGFKVERSTDGASFTLLTYVGANLTSYSNTFLTASTTYYYRVRAYQGPNDSEPSNVASATTQPTPLAPSNLTATALSTSRIDLAWTDNATNEGGFKLERSTDGVNFTQVALLSANVTSFSNTGLAASTTYNYRIRAYEGPNHSSYSSPASATTQAAPLPPSNLAATAVSASRIDLAWTDNATNEAGFKVERSADGVSFALITYLAANVTSFSNTSLAAGTTYYYRVRAYEGPNDSSPSNVASATTQSAPAPPSNLAASVVSSSRIDLAWTDNSTNEAGFKLERSIDQVNFAQVASVGANVTRLSNTGLTASTTYYYRVRAYEGPNDSLPSNVASGTTQATPVAPSSLTATVVSSSRIDLAWTDNAANEAGFKLERSTDGVSFAQVASVGANVTSYSNTGLTSGITYYYRVFAYDGPNNSPYSNVASAMTQAPPAAPSNLTATAVSSSRINLAWTNNATNEAGLELERSINGGSFALLTYLGANVTSYSNTGLTASTSYSYRVRAYDGSNRSPYSNEAWATTQPTPAAPSSLTATGVSSSRIDLAWIDNATNEAGFKLERSTDGMSFTQIALLSPNVRSYSNTSLPASTTYYYRVRAYDEPNHSSYSNSASAMTQPTPAAPSSLRATVVSSSRIDLTWKDNATNEAGFKLERSTDGVSFTQIAALAANVKSFSNTGLSASTTYYYRVRAYDGPNHSAYSNVTSGTTQPPPAAPSNLRATAFSSSRIDLAWTDNATNEAGFKLERSSDGVNFTQIVQLGANAKSYSNTGLSARTTHYYRVRAYDGPNHSAYSNVASATTK